MAVSIREAVLNPRSGSIQVPDGATKEDIRRSIEAKVKDEELAQEARYVAERTECPFLAAYIREVFFSIHDLRHHTEARYVATAAVVMIKNY